jgi:hypothetical protein
MGLVGVHVATPEQLAAVAPSLLTSFLTAEAKYVAHSSQCGKDLKKLADLDAELQCLISPELDIPALSTLRLQVAERRAQLLASNRRELIDPLLAENALIEKFVSSLPPASAKTDADGHFVVPAGAGDWLVAQDCRDLPGGAVEKYLWLCRLSEKKSQVLLANDSLVSTAELVQRLSEWSPTPVKFEPQNTTGVSMATEAWALETRKAAIAARSKALADEFESARARYQRMLGTVQVDMLEKWGGEEWRNLKVEIASITNDQAPLIAAATYSKSTKVLSCLITKVLERDAAYRVEAARMVAQEQERQRIENERAAALAKTQSEAAEAKAKAEQLAQAEKAEREAKLEQLRNSPLFSDSVGISTGFRSFEYGFGFWMESTMKGFLLRIFVDGKTPNSQFSGSNADVSWNIDNRLSGSEQYKSGGHDFLIEWTRTKRMSWSAKIIVRRLN